ncbi:pao retrotransposon peptidase domain-containing protein [Phthorimaea operculella]|nr:pao retrotransposon peptidase domain-containing protein [Phthorimaea operculella]
MNRSGDAGAALDRISEGACPPGRSNAPPLKEEPTSASVTGTGRGRQQTEPTYPRTWGRSPPRQQVPDWEERHGNMAKDTHPSYQVSAVVLDEVVGKLPQVRLPPTVRGLTTRLELADPDFDTPGTVDVLLGSDVLGRLWCVWRPQDLPEGDTVLYGSVLSEVLQRFWESEEPPTGNRRKPEDDECELFYQYNTARCPSGRFVTRLPFLPNRPALGIVHIAIPRKLVPSVGCKATLHGFCDASERGYAAAVYLRTASSTGTVHVRLVMAKSKVAPVRTRWTIPKLELAGAALLARLLNHVTCNLRGTINLDETVYAWTDSRIVLCWLQTSTPATDFDVVWVSD